jgi:hypothetical protein
VNLFQVQSSREAMRAEASNRLAQEKYSKVEDFESLKILHQKESAAPDKGRGTLAVRLAVGEIWTVRSKFRLNEERTGGG